MDIAASMTATASGLLLHKAAPVLKIQWGVLPRRSAITSRFFTCPAAPQLDQYAIRPNFSAVRTYQTVTKYGEVITQPDQVANTMRRAFHHLRNGRPGPVIVELPRDVGNKEVPEAVMDYKPPKRARQAPDEGDVKAAVKILLNAKKPVIWSGMGVLLSGATHALREFAELTGIPVYCTMPGKSSFDERHPLSVGAGEWCNHTRRPAVDTGVGRVVCSRFKHDTHHLRTTHSDGKNPPPQHREHRRHQQGFLGRCWATGRCEIDIGCHDCRGEALNSARPHVTTKPTLLRQSLN